MGKNGRNGAEEISGDYYIETQEEFDELLERESRRLLGVSREEFLRMKAAGTLPEKPLVRSLSMLADLATIS